jgi:hypothetical protein
VLAKIAWHQEADQPYLEEGMASKLAATPRNLRKKTSGEASVAEFHNGMRSGGELRATFRELLDYMPNDRHCGRPIHHGQFP